MPKAMIAGFGNFLPEYILSNEELEHRVDTTCEWIVTRTGIESRRIAGKGEGVSSMGVKAAKSAIEDWGGDPRDIGLVLVATVTPDYIFPSTACLIQGELDGIVSAPAFDIHAACSGYIYALSVANSYIQSGMYDNILVVSSEKISSVVDPHDRATCILFGDGATACIVSGQSSSKGLWIERVYLGADGSVDKNMMIVPAGGSVCPATSDSVAAGEHFLRMEGREIFKHAVRRMEESIKSILESVGVDESGISWLIPHQANVRIIDALKKRFSVPPEKVCMTIKKYGNTSASSVGIALTELIHGGDVLDMDRIVLVTFGAGLTYGAVSLVALGGWVGL